MRWSCVGILVAALSLLPHQQAEAQARPNIRWGQSPPDSTAWRPLLSYIIANTLSDNILDAAIDTTSHAWEMSFPAMGAAWPAIEAHLRTILRARGPLPADTVVWELRIGELTVSGDTARVQVHSGMTKRCPGSARTAGYGNRYDVFVVRHRASSVGSTKFWGGARSDGVLHGDRAGCPRPRQ